MVPFLYFLFFLSGAAGLIYESVWARYLGLFVGHEAYAQVLVLVIFLGGMSLGAILASRRADRIRYPLRSYAIIEAAVGLLGLGFHLGFVASTNWAYAHGFPAVGAGLPAEILKWTVAGALIFPQSVLLGATFPLMSAAVLRHAPAAPGQVLSSLYFVNSLGAALGVLVAGFGLVAAFGLPGTLRTAGALNVIVAVGAVLVSRRHRSEAGTTDRESAGVAVPVDRILLTAALLTAVASFCYEIDWIRMLSLVLGSATHAFELMLSAFILGLALGAFWIRRRLDRLGDPLRTLAAIQILMGLLAVGTLPVYLASFSWMAWLHTALNPSGAGYTLFTIARYGFCLAVMLPATFAAGMTLPLITRMLLARRRSEAAIGQVYAANTLGSILGALLAAIVLLPLVGLTGLVVVAGLIDIGVGALLLAARGGGWRRMLVPAAAAALALVPLGLTIDRRLLVSGVYRGGALDTAKRVRVDYYADGRTATVAVTRTPGGLLALSTNGKVDASLSDASQRRCDPTAPPRQIIGDEITQLLSGILPLGHLQGPAHVAVIGIGSGITTHTMLASPAVASVVTIEIEPRMVDGAKRFAPANRRTFHDPRSRILIGDARAVFAASGHRFDAIVSEPSNPWVSGVSSLFTEEFYRRVAAQLTPTGVFAQWLQAYELDDGSVLRVLRAIDAVFPDWQIHQAGRDDLLILATGAPRLPAPRWDAVARLPLLEADLCGVVPLDPPTLDAALLADRTLLRAAVRRIGAPNSDFHPVLDQDAERRRFEDQNAGALLELGDRWFNYARQLMGRPEAPVPTRATTFGGMRRSVERLTQTWQAAPGDHPAPTPALARIRYDWDRWRHGVRGREPPSDWHGWTEEFQAAARFRHAGTAGWIDEPFFRDASDFATRHRAPDPVKDVIRFRRATQRWDAREALDAAERLGRAGMPGDGAAWISVRDLLDGAVVSAVSLGHRGVAKAWLARFGAAAGRTGSDTISRILAAAVTSPVPE